MGKRCKRSPFDHSVQTSCSPHRGRSRRRTQLLAHLLQGSIDSAASLQGESATTRIQWRSTELRFGRLLESKPRS
ncbi:hypothetical protein ACFPRL_36250 [Pseudoclavibacter helvolus]